MNETDFAGRLSSLMFLGVFRWTRLQSYQRCVVVVLVISYLFVRLFCRHASIDDKLKAWLYLLFSFSYKWKEIKIETLRFVKRIIWALDYSSSGIEYNLELSNWYESHVNRKWQVPLDSYILPFLSYSCLPKMRQINILRPQRHPFSLDKRSAQKQKIRSLFLYRIDNREKKFDDTKNGLTVRWRKIIITFLL